MFDEIDTVTNKGEPELQSNVSSNIEDLYISNNNNAITQRISNKNILNLNHIKSNSISEELYGYSNNVASNTNASSKSRDVTKEDV